MIFQIHCHQLASHARTSQALGFAKAPILRNLPGQSLQPECGFLLRILQGGELCQGMLFRKIFARAATGFDDASQTNAWDFQLGALTRDLAHALAHECGLVNRALGRNDNISQAKAAF
jgi:hypothetical protein